MLDAEVGETSQEHRRSLRRDHRDRDPFAQQEPDAQPIAHVEGLQHLAVGAVAQRAVGEHTIDVEH